MEKGESSDGMVEQDIAKCREGVLVAIRQQQSPLESCDSMPTFGDIMKNRPIRSEFVSNMVEKISRSNQADKSENIPSLDLGMQILARQRNIAALKRKSPSQENNPPQTGKQELKPPPISIRMQLPHITHTTPASPQQMIIADIVAREILVFSAAR